MLTQGGQLLSRFVVKVKELWGSITTEPKRRRCQKMAAMAVTSSGRGILLLNFLFVIPKPIIYDYFGVASFGRLSICSSVV